jgi:hypothetical protein
MTLLYKRIEMANAVDAAAGGCICKGVLIPMRKALLALVLFGTCSFAVVTPTPIPAPTMNGVTVGGGFIEAPNRQVVRTASNIVYVFAADDDPCQLGGIGVIRAWKGTGAQPTNPVVPTAFAEQDAFHEPAAPVSGTCVFGENVGPVFGQPDLRLDDGGTVHLAYIEGNTGNVYYQTFSTATDLWGARTVIATGASTDSLSGWPRFGNVALTLDANNIPHVVFISSGTLNSVKYTNKVSGSWSTASTTFSGTNECNPSMVTALDGTIHLAWLDNSISTHATVKYAKNSGSWGTIETPSMGDSLVLSQGNHDQGPSIAADLNNLPHVLYLDGTVNGSDNYVRLKYRAADGVWSDNTPSGAPGASNPTGTWYAHTPQNYISNVGDEYVFLGHDVNISPAPYQYQLGGVGDNWSAVSQMDPRNSTNTTAGAPGLDGTANARFDPLRDNNTRIIDVLYYDENDGTGSYPHHATIYYKAVDIGDGATTPDFSLTANAPTSATVTAGNNASYVLTLTALNGFSSGVSLACTSLPSGTNCSFSSSNPVTPTSAGSSEIINISTATTTTAGTYTVSVTGTSGTLTPQTITFTLTVQGSQTPSFSIGASPTSSSLKPGTSTAYAISVTPQNAFNSLVSLTCAVPSNNKLGCSLNPTSIMPGTTSTLTVTTTGPTATLLLSPNGKCSPKYMLWLALPAIALAGFGSRRRRLGIGLICFRLMTVTLLLTSCGGGSSLSSGSGGSGIPGTPAGSYSIEVTASSGSLSQTTTVTLNVQ